MATLLFSLAVIIAAVLITVGMVTPQTWVFGLGTLILALAFILGLSSSKRSDHTSHGTSHGH